MEIITAYSTDEKYVKYMCVSVTSLIAHASDENTYRIVVLDDDICDESKELIKSTGKGKSNISFEFINCKNMFPSNIYVGTWNIVAYYRLALIDLFPNEEKILYLDSDTVVLADVAELFKIDLTGYYFAGVRDLEAIYGFRNDKKFVEEVLKLKNVQEYVNAGVLLFNLKELRSKFTVKKLIDIAMRNNFRYPDQDLINTIAQGKLYFLDRKWNFFGITKPHIFLIDDDRMQYEKASKNIGIIHYVVERPWFSTEREYGFYFWKYAFMSPVVGNIWKEFCKDNNYKLYDMWKNEVRVIDGVYAGKVDFKFYLRLAKATFIGNFRKLKGRFNKN